MLTTTTASKYSLFPPIPKISPAPTTRPTSELSSSSSSIHFPVLGATFSSTSSSSTSSSSRRVLKIISLVNHKLKAEITATHITALRELGRKYISASPNTFLTIPSDQHPLPSNCHIEFSNSFEVPMFFITFPHRPCDVSQGATKICQRALCLSLNPEKPLRAKIVARVISKSGCGQQVFREQETVEKVIKICPALYPKQYVFHHYIDKNGIQKCISYSELGKEIPVRQLPLDEFLIFARTLLKGMAALQREHIFHCDFKLDNILMFDRKGKRSYKIIDFGSAGNPNHGTMHILPPEYWNSQPLTPTSADSWALGYVLFTMYNGFEPYWGIPADMCYALSLFKATPEKEGIPREFVDVHRDFQAFFDESDLGQRLGDLRPDPAFQMKLKNLCNSFEKFYAGSKGMVSAEVYDILLEYQLNLRVSIKQAFVWLELLTFPEKEKDSCKQVIAALLNPDSRTRIKPHKALAQLNKAFPQGEETKEEKKRPE